MQAQDYIRQKGERTGASFYIDWIKNLNVSTEMFQKEKIPSLTLHTVATSAVRAAVKT